MSPQQRTAALAGGTVVGGLLAGALARRTSKHRKATDNWQVVTVFLPGPPRDLPQPLAELGARVETRWKTAPGDKGVELRVRSTSRSLAASDLRDALRRSKQLLEAGEILQADSPGTTKKTLLNLPLRAATRRAGRLGHL